MDEFDRFNREEAHLDYITFSGSGEPTLNSDIGYFIREIKKLTSVPVAVLTNGTLLHLPEVRDDLLRSDLILPSLDAVSEDVFRRINRPAAGITPSGIIKGIQDFSRIYSGEIWLEVFIAKGINDTEDELEKLREAIGRINPSRVQLNSLDRPPAYREAESADHRLLEKIVKKWKGLPVEIIKRVKTREEISSFSQNLENSILNTIARRPLTVDDLITLTGKDRPELLKYIDILEKEKKLKPEITGDKIFYRSAEDRKNLF